MIRRMMKGWANAAVVQRITCWRAALAGAKAEREAANAAADAMGDAARAEKGALKAAEAEAAKIKEMLRNANGDEAVQLMEQLQAAEKEAAETNRKLGEKIMQFVGKRWRYAIVIRGMTSWKVQMTSAAEADKAAIALSMVGSVTQNQAIGMVKRQKRDDGTRMMRTIAASRQRASTHVLVVRWILAVGMAPVVSLSSNRGCLLRVMRLFMNAQRNACIAEHITCWSCRVASTRSDEALAKAVSDALQAAQAEASEIQQSLKDASQEERLKLTEQLVCVQNAAKAAKQKMNRILLRWLCRKRAIADITRVITSWRLTMAIYGEQLSASEAIGISAKSSAAIAKKANDDAGQVKWDTQAVASEALAASEAAKRHFGMRKFCGTIGVWQHSALLRGVSCWMSNMMCEKACTTTAATVTKANEDAAKDFEETTNLAEAKADLTRKALETEIGHMLAENTRASQMADHAQAEAREALAASGAAKRQFGLWKLQAVIVVSYRAAYSQCINCWLSNVIAASEVNIQPETAEDALHALNLANEKIEMIESAARCRHALSLRIMVYVKGTWQNALMVRAVVEWQLSCEGLPTRQAPSPLTQQTSIRLMMTAIKRNNHRKQTAAVRHWVSQMTLTDTAAIQMKMMQRAILRARHEPVATVVATFQFNFQEAQTVFALKRSRAMACFKHVARGSDRFLMSNWIKQVTRRMQRLFTRRMQRLLHKADAESALAGQRSALFVFKSIQAGCSDELVRRLLLGWARSQVMYCRYFCTLLYTPLV
jgi:hypothetical protein